MIGLDETVIERTKVQLATLNWKVLNKIEIGATNFHAKDAHRAKLSYLLMESF